MAEADARTVAVLTALLPEAGAAAPGDHDGTLAVAHAVDAVDGMVALALPRLVTAALPMERAARAMRRTVALLARLEAGWPRGPGRVERAEACEHDVGQDEGELEPADAAGALGGAGGWSEGIDSDLREGLMDDLRADMDDSGLAAVLFPGNARAAVRDVLEEAAEAVARPVPPRLAGGAPGAAAAMGARPPGKGRPGEAGAVLPPALPAIEAVMRPLGERARAQLAAVGRTGPPGLTRRD